MNAPKIVSVKTDLTPTQIVLTPIWDGVTQTEGTAWGVDTMSMARRLERALLAGVVYKDAKVAQREGSNFTTVEATPVISPGRLRSGLKKLGF